MVFRTKLRLKRPSIRYSEPVEMYNAKLLRDITARNEFLITLSNRLQAFVKLIEDEIVGEQWKVVREAGRSSCHQV